MNENNKKKSKGAETKEQKGMKIWLQRVIKKIETCDFGINFLCRAVWPECPAQSRRIQLS